MTANVCPAYALLGVRHLRQACLTTSPFGERAGQLQETEVRPLTRARPRDRCLPIEQA